MLLEGSGHHARKLAWAGVFKWRCSGSAACVTVVGVHVENQKRHLLPTAPPCWADPDRFKNAADALLCFWATCTTVNPARPSIFIAQWRLFHFESQSLMAGDHWPPLGFGKIGSWNPEANFWHFTSKFYFPIFGSKVILEVEMHALAEVPTFRD